MINILVSRPYVKKDTFRILEWYSRAAEIRFLIDCGAFTDYMAAKPAMPIDKYNAWLRDVLPRFAEIGEVYGYMALDVIGNAEATAANYEVMLDAGFKPIPVITRGTPVDHISRMVDTASIIAFGGLAGTTLKERAALRWMIDQIPPGFPNHWLGFTDYAFVRHYQPASFDSSNWNQANRWGRLHNYRGDFTFGRKIKYGLTLNRNDSRSIRAAGFDPALLGDIKVGDTPTGTTWLSALKRRILSNGCATWKR